MMGTLRRGLAAACCCAFFLTSGCVVSEQSYNTAIQERDQLASQLAESQEQVAFGEAELGQAYQEAFAADKRVCLVKINSKEDVWPALKKFFSKHPELQTI